MLGPRPSAKKVFQLLPPGFRCFSPLSPFLLEFKSKHRRPAEELGPSDSPSLLGILLTFPQVKLGPWKLWARWVSPADPGSEPGLPLVLAGEWRGRCPQGTWAWGGGSGLGSRERGQLSAPGLLKATGKAKRYSPSPGPAACPPGLARQGARTDQAGMGGQQAGEEEE